MFLYKTLLALFIFLLCANAFSIVLPEPSDDSRPSEIAISIACLYYFETIDTNGNQLKSIVNAQNYLGKLLGENDIPHAETVHYITLTMHNLAKKGIDKDYYKLRCQGLQVVD